jgi:16S rRNA (guanine966-N2)-methyltransferase
MGLRIIGGAARGRRLSTPAGRGTRPTSDRVREALFSMLEAALDLGAQPVLDLFAGSGALGLEALSRGAPHATFVDSDRGCQRVILENARALGYAEACRLLPFTVSRGLTQLEGEGARYGLVLVDPPYADALEPLLLRIASSGVVAVDGRLSLEHDKRGEPPGRVGQLELVTRRRYGDTAISIYANNKA